MHSINQQIIVAKEKFKQSLVTYNGETKHSEVLEAINALSKLNPTTAPVANESLLQGNWLLINAPNFPNRQFLIVLT